MSLTLSSTMLTAMRAQVESLLPDSCVIQSVSLASDSAGGSNETWAAVTGGTVACRLDPLGTRVEVQVLAGREAMNVDYRLTVPYDAPLAANRRIVTGGKTYEVVNIDDVHSWNVSRRAIVSGIR